VIGTASTNLLGPDENPFPAWRSNAGRNRGDAAKFSIEGRKRVKDQLRKALEDEVAVHVVTVEDEFNGDRQTENLHKITEACAGIGIRFTWEYAATGTRHDRDITTDLGWKILLSRGLDVFQRFELNDAFDFANRLQQHRRCKEFNVTYVRI
jgi:hypothetical protein